MKQPHAILYGNLCMLKSFTRETARELFTSDDASFESVWSWLKHNKYVIAMNRTRHLWRCNHKKETE